MTNLNITLNNEKFKTKLEYNRSKRLERYIFSYVVEREGWQMAENIVENFFDAKNVNFHDPKFPLIDLIVKKNSSHCKKNELLNVKSSRQLTLRSAIFSSIRGKYPSRKFLISQINYILRSTNTTKAGDQMLGSKILKSIKRNKDFNKNLKHRILLEYNKAHRTELKKFDQIPILNKLVSTCFIYNPFFANIKEDILCSIVFEKTKTKVFRDLFNRTLKKCFDKNYNIADLIFYVFSEKNGKFSHQFTMSTVLNADDVKKIRKVYGLNGAMSNLKNDLINQIRDMGNLKDLRMLKKNIAIEYLTI